MTDANKQTAATLNQIDNEKPNIPKTEATLRGNIAGSFNGGMYKTIGWKKVMAGEAHKQMNIRVNMQTLTPLTPAFQKLRCEIQTFFVPDSRVWNNAEDYLAQRGGATVDKILEIPNIGGKILPSISRQTDETILLSDTTGWRDSYISAYLPRFGKNVIQEDGYSFTMPKVNALPLRGFKAIYNDFLRNKEYEPEQQEYKSDTVSDAEWNSYLPNGTNFTNTQMRARRNNSYYMNYRTELQGFEADYPTEGIGGGEITDASKLVTFAEWMQLANEGRSESENAQLNAWDVIAKIRGSKKLTEGKVQLIGRTEFELNYNSITQSAYNTNDAVAEEFRVMGKQGAYSYTYIKMPIYAGMKFNEEGFIHVIAHVYADTVFESGIDRTLLNITTFDEYRPDLVEQKDDVLYEIEFGTSYNALTEVDGKIVGFKRKFSEYVSKLPNVIQGDMTTPAYYQTNVVGIGAVGQGYGTQVLTQSTYQFFMPSATYVTDHEGTPITVARNYKDYTDIMMNNNMAITQKVDQNIFGIVQVQGPNQIFFAGELELDAILPVDGKRILNNYTQWGEI